MPVTTPPPSARALIFGGLLPVIAYTLVEMYFGYVWGLIFGIAFGLAEVGFEWFRYHKVEKITLFSNGLLVFLGLISVLTSSSTFFKLQPSILEASMAGIFVATTVMGQPLIWVLAEKQGMASRVPEAMIPHLKSFMTGLNLRIGFFFLAHAVLAAYAAFYWSTQTWAILKGVAFTISMFIYLILEVVVFRFRLKKSLASQLVKKRNP